MNSGEDYRVIANGNICIYVKISLFNFFIFFLFSFWWKFGNSCFHWNPNMVFVVARIFCKTSCWANYIHSSRASMRGRKANNLITERIQSRDITLCIFHPTSLKVTTSQLGWKKRRNCLVRMDITPTTFPLSILDGCYKVSPVKTFPKLVQPEKNQVKNNNQKTTSYPSFW